MDTLYLYGDVGYEITARETAAFLEFATGDITVRISSNGGDAYEGVAITSLLRSYDRGKVTIIIDGLAASAASVIAVGGGDEVLIAPGAEIMVHSAWSTVTGNASELTVFAENLDRFTRSIAGVYASATNTSIDEWMDILGAETWFSAEEAVEAGLADSILEPQEAPVNIPEQLVDIDTSLTQNRGIQRIYASRRDAPPPPIAQIKDDNVTKKFMQALAEKLGVNEQSPNEDLLLQALDEALEEVNNNDDASTDNADSNGRSDASPDDSEEKVAEDSAADTDNAEEVAEEDSTEEVAEEEAEQAEEVENSTPAVIADSVTVDRGVYEDLLARAELGAEAFQAQKRKEAEDLVSAAIKSGKVLSAKREALVDTALEDMDAMRAHLDSLTPGLVPVAETGRAVVSNSDKSTAGSKINETIYSMFRN